MKKLLFRLAVFSVPFMAYFLLVLLVDPFNVFGISDVIDDAVKRRNTSNVFLWKYTEFRRKPAANILLGDSRMEALDVRQIKKLTGENYYNFAYGGGSLMDSIHTFSYATKSVRLKKVYLGINLNMYSARSYGDNVAYAERIFNNKLLYFIDTNTVLSASRVIRQYAASTPFSNDLRERTGKAPDSQEPKPGSTRPDTSREQFWAFQLGPITDRVYANYAYPEEGYELLRKIAEFCGARNIELVFVILPTHTDAQQKVREYHLDREYARFKEDIRKLGKVYDFDLPNEFTRDRSNFTDPYHVVNANRIIDEVWGGRITYSAVSTPPWSIYPPP